MILIDYFIAGMVFYGVYSLCEWLRKKIRSNKLRKGQG